VKSGKRKDVNERLAEKRGFYGAIVDVSLEAVRGTTRKARGILLIVLASGATFLGLAKIGAAWWMAAMVLFLFMTAILLIANEGSRGNKNKSNWSG
jgi:hypothetical protein